jgi:hypothetical protein
MDEDGCVQGEDMIPLDDKLGLFVMNGARSRYSETFAGNAAYIMATVTTREGVDMLNRLLGIHIAPEQFEDITLSAGMKYLPEKYDTDVEDENIPAGDICPEGFLADRIKQIDTDPDRDEIIRRAVDEGICGNHEGVADANHRVSYTLADGKGVNGLPRELSSKGKDGGSARRFEAKIGSVFSQDFDVDGLPILRGGEIFRADQTRYIGTVEKIGQFRPLLRDFAAQCGAYEAAQQVYLSDGAIWLSGIQERYFPNAIVIVDKYHSIEHLNEMIDGLGIRKKASRETLRKKARRMLDLGEIEKLSELISEALISARESVSKITKGRLEYFIKNKEKMKYGLFTAVGLFIGSGVVEAACKTIIQKRMECAGMRWSKKMAAVIIALRCAIQSGTYDHNDEYEHLRDRCLPSVA